MLKKVRLYLRKKTSKKLPLHLSVLRNFGIFFLGIVLYLFAVSVNFLWLFGKSPGLEQLENPQAPTPSEIYTSDGVLIGRYYTENRSPVTYRQISPNIIKALVATEDARFYRHSGIDIPAMFGVIYSNLIGDGRGGSTITQQLAKNLYNTRESESRGLLGYLPLVNTIISKTKEWMTSVQLERNYTKQEILAMYLNTVDFGSNSFGIKTAARTFFNTSTDSLNLQQSAVLVGLLKAPTWYSPVSHPVNSLRRRNIVLAQMLKYRLIKLNQYRKTIHEPLSLNRTFEEPYEGPAAYFRTVLNNSLKDWCRKTNHDLYTDGLKIYTTLDSRMQHHAEEAVQEKMIELQKKFNRHWGTKQPWVDERDSPIVNFIGKAARQTSAYKYYKLKYKNNTDSINRALNMFKTFPVYSLDEENFSKDTIMSTLDSLEYYKRFLHAGFVSMDPFSGNVKAWVGGIDYRFFKYDHVFQGKRQPGSTFKPFVYAAALSKGFSPCDRRPNSPITINYTENGEAKSWSPHNSDYEFTGEEFTLRRAMAKSVNVVAARITQEIGWNTVVEEAHNCGITSSLKSVPSICLGSSDVSLFELVGAYSTFINNGVWIEPNYLTRIDDHNGKTVERFTPKTHRALSEEVAWLMVYMLKGGMDESGTTAELWGYDLWHPYNEMGGKTGTSSNYSDGWFVGASKDLVSGAWVGGEDRCIHFKGGSTMGEGAHTALPLFGDYMEKIYDDERLGIKHAPFPKPPVKIQRPYECTYREKRDSSSRTDSLPK